MKAYHLRRTVSDARIDFLYIPEHETLKGYIDEPKCKLIVDYSLKPYLKRVQAVAEGKEDEVSWEILKEFEVDKKTAKK